MPRFPGGYRWVQGLALSGALAAALIATTPTIAASPATDANLAQGAAGLLNLDVKSACTGGDVSFRIRNAGRAWPKSATFVIYRLGRGQPQAVVKRRMRLKDGQRASFRIKKRRNPTGQLGIFVEPGWYARPFALDARIDCAG